MHNFKTTVKYPHNSWTSRKFVQLKNVPKKKLRIENGLHANFLWDWPHHTSVAVKLIIYINNLGLEEKKGSKNQHCVANNQKPPNLSWKCKVNKWCTEQLHVLSPYEFSTTGISGPYIKRQRSLNEPTILEATSLKNTDAIWSTKSVEIYLISN